MIGINNGAPAAASGSRTDVVLPPAPRQAQGAGMEDAGRGASVEVSISPQARAMLTIDMASLAAKGYSQVNIDTDGRPGAEISVSVDPSRGTVAVGTEQTLGQLRAMLGEDKLQKLLDMLLKLLQERQQQRPSGPAEPSASQTSAEPQVGLLAGLLTPAGQRGGEQA